MGKNKGRRKRVASLDARVVEHRAKITAELLKLQPNQGLLNFWHRETQNLGRQRDKTLSKLPGARRRR